MELYSKSYFMYTSKDDDSSISFIASLQLLLFEL